MKYALFCGTCETFTDLDAPVVPERHGGHVGLMVKLSDDADVGRQFAQWLRTRNHMTVTNMLIRDTGRLLADG